MKQLLLLPVLLCGAGLAHAADGNGPSRVVGSVFAATNDASHNEIVMYNRHEGGQLDWVGKFATGGRGEGGINDPLQSQHSLCLTPDHKFLLAINAGSSTVSLFGVSFSGLNLLDTKTTEGGNPVSVAVHDDLVYVANVGGTYHTAGFRLKPWGELEFIKNSKQHLSSLDTEPGTIQFSPDGTKVIVTERQTNNIDVFSVALDGTLTNAVVNASQGIEPFGATFTSSGTLLVSEAAFGSVSSYTVNADNTLAVITSKSPSSGAATCWVVPGGSYAYATSAITSSVSTYKLDSAGTLTALGITLAEPGTTPAIFPPVGITSFPIDLALTPDNKFLYVVYSALGRVIGYQVGPNGEFTKVTSVVAYAPQIGAEGLEVY